MPGCGPRHRGCSAAAPSALHTRSQPDAGWRAPSLYLLAWRWWCPRHGLLRGACSGTLPQAAASTALEAWRGRDSSELTARACGWTRPWGSHPQRCCSQMQAAGTQGRHLLGIVQLGLPGAEQVEVPAAVQLQGGHLVQDWVQISVLVDAELLDLRRGRGCKCLSC